MNALDPMKTPHKTKTIRIAALAALFALLAAGCTTTRSENGVIIQESGGWNPLNYLPFF